jgi:hypothetical protein
VFIIKVIVWRTFMKRCLIVSLLLSVSALVGQVSAQSPIPYTNTFESLYGASIITNPAAGSWDGTVEYAYVTNGTPTNVNVLLSGETHTNVMVFDSTILSNSFVGSSYPYVYVDTLIRPEFSVDGLSTNGEIASSQMGIAFDTNGYICVYHGVAAGFGLLTNTQWSVFTNASVTSGQWARVSVTLSYNWGDWARAVFKIKLNGIELSNEYGCATEDLSAGGPGPWFRAAIDDVLVLRNVALAGRGAIDDLLVSDTAPPSYPRIFVQTTGSGSVTPSGIVYLQAVDAATNFTIQASPYWAIAAASTGDYPITLSGTLSNALQQNSYAFTWSNIVADGSLVINFAALVASNGIPYEWLAANGLGTNDYPQSWNTLASGDWDNDGRTTFEEWISGTEPNNSNSLLKIISQTISGSNVSVQWLSSTSTLNGVDYTFDLSTNLLGTWLGFTNIPATVQGTNILSTPAPSLSPAFLRVTVTNTYVP